MKVRPQRPSPKESFPKGPCSRPKMRKLILKRWLLRRIKKVSKRWNRSSKMKRTRSKRMKARMRRWKIRKWSQRRSQKKT